MRNINPIAVSAVLSLSFLLSSCSYVAFKSYTVNPKISEKITDFQQKPAVNVENLPAAKENQQEKRDISHTAHNIRICKISDDAFSKILPYSYMNEKMIKDSQKPIPIVRISDRMKLTAFFEDTKDSFIYDQDYGCECTFSEFYSALDDKYFEKNELFILYIGDIPSGSIRFTVDSCSVYGGDTLFFGINEIIPEVCTEDMADWFIAFDIPKDEISGFSGKYLARTYIE